VQSYAKQYPTTPQKHHPPRACSHRNSAPQNVPSLLRKPSACPHRSRLCHNALGSQCAASLRRRETGPGPLRRRAALARVLCRRAALNAHRVPVLVLRRHDAVALDGRLEPVAPQRLDLGHQGRGNLGGEGGDDGYGSLACDQQLAVHPCSGRPACNVLYTCLISAPSVFRTFSIASSSVLLGASLGTLMITS
jgi:hypothetical protein